MVGAQFIWHLALNGGYLACLVVPLNGAAKKPLENDVRLRVIARETLCNLGYTVLHAANGAEALAMIDAVWDAVLLFTGIVMPGMTGRKLAEKVPERLPYLKVP
ncbi:hypothetical protein ACSFA3_21745 [Variovorax sp. RHLX14]|uniref:hypothetical protein n=1 Tax=Variovorax sp. RHLX14 TaxID=1259731 RepID=UPI003F448256